MTLSVDVGKSFIIRAPGLTSFDFLYLVIFSLNSIVSFVYFSYSREGMENILAPIREMTISSGSSSVMYALFSPFSTDLTQIFCNQRDLPVLGAPAKHIKAPENPPPLRQKSMKSYPNDDLISFFCL